MCSNVSESRPIASSRVQPGSLVRVTCTTLDSILIPIDPVDREKLFPKMSSNESALEPYKVEFIEKAMESKVLLFGDFTLKSGRWAPCRTG